jgi:hypothetical protein
MDPRTNEETYKKTINPGRSAARGEFSYSEKQDISEGLYAGWHIFDLDAEKTFGAAEHNEIWFTFNLVANFLDNPCYKSEALTLKLINWLESISSAYPYDASMCAALSHSYLLVGNSERSALYTERVIDILNKSEYWRTRFEAFPELFVLSSISDLTIVGMSYIKCMPETLMPQQYLTKFEERLLERDSNGWKD